ncbi:MAG TPA: SUF system Fe-S cluster assembly regulator [Halothiobacillus sp.]|nr:MAG: SUF system Fe-S cluster assembly regulator [Halothiobacillus sp. 20-54-6]HQT42396.1 SUF system Fe-S cluster assembly regulator [Halothiobacillus sp.]
MLKISRMSDYAIVLLTALAHSNAQSNARALADTTQLTLPTVGKLLKTLSAQGLLISQQGRNGGYRLARSTESISLADIIEAIDGPIAMTDCFDPSHDCDREANCTVRPHWQAINQGMHALLDKITLARLIQPVNPESQLAVPVWFSKPAPGGERVKIPQEFSSRAAK